MTSSFTYYAFISYSQHDIHWGKRLERKLAGYKMPATLCSERGWKRKPINPIFFAPYDIQPGDLDEELKSRLRASRNLVVICSPSSAQSEWVAKEIRYFHALGRDKNIFFFIVDGEPHSKNPERECFNPVVRDLNIPEILGANVHEQIYNNPYLNRERAYVQLISKLLNVEFDSIWKRHKRQLIRKLIVYVLGILMFLGCLFLVWQQNKDISIGVQTQEKLPYNQHLPELRDFIITMYIDEEKKVDTIHNTEMAQFQHIPGRFRNKQVRLTVTHADFTPQFYEVDTLIPITKNIVIPIVRDTNEYGKISLQLKHKKTNKPIVSTIAIIDNDTVSIDSSGQIMHHVTFSKQTPTYSIYIPQYKVWDTIYMPAQEKGIIIIDTKMY